MAVNAAGIATSSLNENSESAESFYFWRGSECLMSSTSATTGYKNPYGREEFGALRSE